MKIRTLLLSFPLLATASGITDIEKFFQAQGTIIAKADNGTWVCDKGLPYFKPGLPVAIYRGTKVKNPLTGEETLVLIKETGEGTVINSFKKSSLIKATTDKGIKIGDIARLRYQKVCFVGSDFSFERLQEDLPLFKTSDIGSCKWAVEETNEGFRVFYNGEEVFFAKKELPTYAYAPQKISIEDLHLVAKATEIKSFNDIPVGIDTVKVGKREFVVIGFTDKLELYENINGSLVGLGSLAVPVGQLVGVQFVNVDNNLYIIGNAFTSDAQPVSFIATLVNTSPVIVQDNIPYLIGVLNKEEPKKFIFAQKFQNGFGKVYRASLGKSGLQVGKEVEVPDGFRVDTAVYTEDGVLAYIDPSGVLRIFKGSFKGGFTHLQDIDGEFGYSYNYIEIPSVVGDTALGKVFFPPRPVAIQLFGVKGFLVAQNKATKLLTFFGSSFFKLQLGKLLFVGRNPKGIFITKTFAGATFTDSVQGIGLDKNGTPFVVSGWKNPFIFQRGGKLYKIEFRYF